MVVGLSGGINAAQGQTRLRNEPVPAVIGLCHLTRPHTPAWLLSPSMKVPSEEKSRLTAPALTSRLKAPTACLFINTATKNVIDSIAVDFTHTPLAILRAGTPVSSGNQGGSSVSAMDTATNAMIATILVDALRSDLAVSPDGTRVYVTTFNSVSVINALTDTVSATIPVGRPDPIH